MQVNLKIIGSVQGVGFRYALQQEARRIGLSGYVANLVDGSVELVAEGPEADLKTLIKWCYTGVEAAKVKTIEITWKSGSSQFQDFMIKF